MPTLESDGSHSNWQRNVSTRSDRLAYLFDHGVLSDVIFIVGKERARLKAHKLILMMSSRTFENIFHSGLASFSSRSKKTEIEVPDIKPSTFQAMLRFLYRGDISIDKEDIDSVMSLLIVANKYKLEDLVTQCTVVIISQINASNVLSIYHLAHIMSISELVKYTFEFICRNAYLIFNSQKALKTLSPQQLESLFVSDELNVGELQLFQYAVKWAKEACRSVNVPPEPAAIKSMLTKLIPHIRFGLFTASQVSNYVTPLKIFSSDELVKLYIAVTRSQSISDISNNNIYINPFKEPRLRNRFGILRRFSDRIPMDLLESKTCSPCRPNWQCISFKVDRKIRIYGVSIFGVSSVFIGEIFHSRGYNFSYEVRLLDSECNILHRQNGSLITVGEIVFVKFDSMIYIQSNHLYTLSTTIKSLGRTYVGNGGSSEIQVPWKGEVVTFKFKKTPKIQGTTRSDPNLKIECGNVTDVQVGEFPEIAFTF